MVTNKLLHAHVFRTGGFLFRGILRKIDGLTIYQDLAHRPVDDMLDTCSHLEIKPPPIVAFIRNPLSWYVSQWCWVAQALPGYRCSFRSYLEVIREASTADENITTLTYNYYNHIQAHRAHRVGRFENLYQDIEDILADTMPNLVSRARIRELLAAEPVYHPSLNWQTGQATEHYSHYYGPQTKQWVERWDAAIIALFDYKFEEK